MQVWVYKFRDVQDIFNKRPQLFYPNIYNKKNQISNKETTLL